MQVNKAAMQLSSTEVELSCLIGCTPSAHPAYVWLKNGQKTPQVTARYRDHLQPGGMGFLARSMDTRFTVRLPCVSSPPRHFRDSRFALFLQFSSLFLFFFILVLSRRPTVSFRVLQTPG